MRLNAKEYYLWKSKEGNLLRNNSPWKRKFLNIEFLNFEKKIINSLHSWRSLFIKAEKDKVINRECKGYSLPIEPDASWKVSIQEVGNFHVRAISALPNDLQAICILLFPKDVPLNYQPIRILSGKKILIYNSKRFLAEPVLIVYDWEPMPFDEPYLDIPNPEKNIVSKIFGEFGSDKTVVDSIQSTVVGAPKSSQDGVGGISLQSKSQDSKLSEEVIKTLMMMVPPELRDCLPPKMQSGEFVRNYRPGISLKVSEKKFRKSLVGGLAHNDYNNILSKFKDRKSVLEESSVFASLLFENKNIRKDYMASQNIINNFSASEITFANELSEEMGEYNLLSIQKNINEDLWLQIINLRKTSPQSKEADKINISKILNKDIDALSSEVFPNSDIRRIALSAPLRNLGTNIDRLAQSISRSRLSNKVTHNDYMSARNIFVDNFGKLTENYSSIFKNIAKSKNSEPSKRHQLIIRFLDNNPSRTTMEIWESLKNTWEFKDIIDLQSVLDWEIKNLHISLNSGRYSIINYPSKI
ncbi:MAG: hypothetical protein V1888_01160 [archaeon]